MLILIYLVSVLKHTDSARPTVYNYPQPIENSQRLMLTTPTEISLVLDSPPSTTEAMTTMENFIPKSNDYAGTHPLFPIPKQTTTPMVPYRTGKSNVEDETTIETGVTPNPESAIANPETAISNRETSIPNPESTIHASQHIAGTVASSRETTIPNLDVPSNLSPRAAIHNPELVVHKNAEPETTIPYAETSIENPEIMISHPENVIHTSHQNEDVNPRAAADQNLRTISNPENSIRNPETMIPPKPENEIPNPKSAISNLGTIISKPGVVTNLNLETITSNPQSTNLHSKAVNPDPDTSIPYAETSIENPRSSIPNPEIVIHASHHTQVSNSEASSNQNLGTVIPNPQILIHSPETMISNSENAIPGTIIPKPEVIPNVNLEATILNPENSIRNSESTIASPGNAIHHPESTIDNVGTTIPNLDVTPNLDLQAAIPNPEFTILHKKPTIPDPEIAVPNPETTIPISEAAEHVIPNPEAMHSGLEMSLNRNLEAASPNRQIIISEPEMAHNPNLETANSNREIILPESEVASDLGTAISNKEVVVSEEEVAHNPILETSFPNSISQINPTISIPDTTIPYPESIINKLEAIIPIPETSIPNPEAASPFKRSLSLDELKMFATTTELNLVATADTTISRVNHTEEQEVKGNKELPSGIPAPSTTSLPYEIEGTKSPGTPSPTTNADTAESDNLFMDNWSKYVSQDDNDSQIYPPEEVSPQLIDLKEPSESFFQNEEFIPLEAPIPKNSDSQEEHNTAQPTEGTKPSRGLFKQDSFKDRMLTLETPPLLSPGGLLDLFTLDHLPSTSNIRPTWWAKPNNAPIPLPAADTNGPMKSYKRNTNGIHPIEESAEVNAVPKMFNHNQFEDLDTLLSEKLKDSVNFLERLFGNLL